MKIKIFLGITFFFVILLGVFWGTGEYRLREKELAPEASDILQYADEELDIEGESENADEFFVNECVESEIVEQISATEEDRELDVANYSLYLKKIWLVDGWEAGWDYPVSLVITEVEEGNICGYLKFDENILPYYCNMSSYGEKYVCPFQGIVYDGVAECEYIDSYYNKQGVFQLTFCGNDRVEVELEGDEAKQYLLRPYNISDEKFCEELTTIEVELDSWGMVYLAYANYDNRHSIPGVMLINEQGDILYNFSGHYQQGSTVCDVMIEDMNGDGLKDIRVGTTFAQEEQTPMFEAYFYQEESGLFYLESYKALADLDNSQTISEEELSTWVGEYTFLELDTAAGGSPMMMDFVIKICENGYADIFVNGQTTCIGLRSEIQGDKEEISHLFAEYLPEDVTSGDYWERSDVLVSFRKAGDDIYTYWGELKDVVLLYGDRISGKIYFEKNIEAVEQTAFFFEPGTETEKEDLIEGEMGWHESITIDGTTSNSVKNEQDLEVRNEVYSLERERIENLQGGYHVTINFPQLEGTVASDVDINKVNSLLKDAAFSLYGKTSVEAITGLEEELRDPNAFEGTLIDYNILQLENDYISLVFSIDSCVGGPSYHHQYLVTIDIENGEYIYFNDFVDIDAVLEVLKSGNFEVYAGTYSEFSDEDAHDPDVVSCFMETFQEQIRTSTTEGNFDRFSSRNIGLDQEYLYIYFPFEEGPSFHGYYILCVPRNLLDATSPDGRELFEINDGSFEEE